MATSTHPSLTVEERSERGSRATRRLRREGYVPGVVYGGGDCITFKVGSRDLRAALVSGSAVLDLEIAGAKARPVIVKDQQIHPVREEILHVDLLEVRLDEKIQSTVAVDLEGAEEAPGAKEGGVVEHVSRELNIEALPGNLPDRIVVDVSHLEAAATMHLSEVQPPEGVEFLDDPEDTIIATVTIPTQVEEPEVEEETELVGEEGEAVEGEAAEGEAEGGEAPAEGGGDSGDESS
jgi:large subunit ribosomal protein L25